MAQNGNLSERQNRFIDELLASSTVKQAAAACHIPERTAYRWMKDPAVQERYREKLRELHQANMANLVKLGRAALVTLARNLNAKSEMVQSQTAIKIIEMCMESYKVAELETLLEDLKGRVPQHGQLRRIN